MGPFSICRPAAAALVAGLAVWGGSVSEAFAVPPGDLLIVERETALAQVAQGQLAAVTSLPAQTVVRVAMANPPQIAVVPRRFTYVRTLRRGFQLEGWVDCGDCVSVVGLVQSASQSLPPGAGRGTMPAVIRGSSAAIQNIWRDIDRKIADVQRQIEDLDARITAAAAGSPEYEQLRRDRLDLCRAQLDQYSARAELWTAARNHDEALRDYLDAIKLSLGLSDEDLLARTQYVVQFHEALSRTLNRRAREPVQPPTGEARSHYARGYHAFWNGEMATALAEFGDAVQLNERDPVYWYYRALTFKRLAEFAAAKDREDYDTRAEHDARMGASLEHLRRPSWDAQTPRYVDGQLQRVQGAPRFWLDNFRHGEGYYDPRQQDAAQIELLPTVRQASQPVR